jgi:hypothetical protein
MMPFSSTKLARDSVLSRRILTHPSRLANPNRHSISENDLSKEMWILQSSK